ncbi:MAG: HAMP domain-containing histidine kinase [Acidobacteriota bacterium]|nr:HAMP domain-containing histidine kinase [Acidobacteriota bacterium]
MSDEVADGVAAGGSDRASGDGNGRYELSADRLRHVNRQAMVGQFVSGVAHELNNPLQVVAGLVELLQSRPDLPPDVLTKLEKIATHATRATDTIRNLLSFARDSRSERMRLDLRRIVDHAMLLRRYQQARGRITATLDLAPEGGCTVSGSAQQLEQLVLNLVINAEQALGRLPEGTERQLLIRLWNEGGKVRLMVRDNGPGIPPDERAELFRPFVSTLPEQDAVGLGLPVAQAIASNHGGRLWLEETPGGAVLMVELPVDA